jgi:hypothetical protein
VPRRIFLSNKSTFKKINPIFQIEGVHKLMRQKKLWKKTKGNLILKIFKNKSPASSSVNHFDTEFFELWTKDRFAIATKLREICHFL